MYAADVSQADFDEQVVKASYKQPVVIDFWAPWCGPCKVLKPMLEKLAEEYAGKFVLVKVNSDENQELSAKYAVRSIPSVKAMVNGQIVDEFAGALPEGEVRKWLEKIIPSPAEELRLAAQQDAAAGNMAGALKKLAEAAGLDSTNEWVRVDAAGIMLATGQMAEAKRLLETVKKPDVLKDNRVVQLQAHVKLAAVAASGLDEASLKSEIAADEKNLDARLKLANLLVATGRYQEGMDQLLEIVQRDRKFQDDIGRKTLLDVFSLLGGQGELVMAYRRKLAGVLN
ncbi:MAG: thioredoxin [Gallionellaceae bacterium]|nr:thioredoxin [Gallionellaceae bacterium]